MTTPPGERTGTRQRKRRDRMTRRYAWLWSKTTQAKPPAYPLDRARCMKQAVDSAKRSRVLQSTWDSICKAELTPQAVPSSLHPPPPSHNIYSILLVDFAGLLGCGEGRVQMGMALEEEKGREEGQKSAPLGAVTGRQHRNNVRCNMRTTCVQHTCTILRCEAPDVHSVTKVPPPDCDSHDFSIASQLSNTK